MRQEYELRVLAAIYCLGFKLFSILFYVKSALKSEERSICAEKDYEIYNGHQS